MTFAPPPSRRTITIDRLEIDVRGVDASTVQAALGALPAATARALASWRAAGANVDSLDGHAVTLGARPAADDVARAIAGRIARAAAEKTAEKTAAETAARGGGA